MNEQKKHLNLSAINGHKIDSEHTNVSENKSQWGIKINLASIRAEKNDISLNPISLENSETKTSDTNMQKNVSVEALKTPLIDKEMQQPVEKKEIAKLKISSLKTPLNISEPSEKTEKICENQNNQKAQQICKLTHPLKQKNQLEQLVHENIDKKNHNQEVFSNYESDYKKEEGNVLEWIQKLKKIANIKKMSKINKIFISSLVVVSIASFVFLFYMQPANHSLNDYKASILTLAGKEMTEQEVQEHKWEIQKEIEWKLEENNLWGYQLHFEILVDEYGAATYKFDGNQYQTKQDLDNAISEKLEFLKKEKIRNYLKQNYSEENIQDESIIKNIDENIISEDILEEETILSEENTLWDEKISENSQMQVENTDAQETISPAENLSEETNISQETEQTNSQNTSSLWDKLQQYYSQDSTNQTESSQEDIQNTQEDTQENITPQETSPEEINDI